MVNLQGTTVAKDYLDSFIPDFSVYVFADFVHADWNYVISDLNGHLRWNFVFPEYLHAIARSLCRLTTTCRLTDTLLH